MYVAERFLAKRPRLKKMTCHVVSISNWPTYGGVGICENVRRSRVKSERSGQRMCVDTSILSSLGPKFSQSVNVSKSPASRWTIAVFGFPVGGLSRDVHVPRRFRPDRPAPSNRAERTLPFEPETAVVTADTRASALTGRNEGEHRPCCPVVFN